MRGSTASRLLALAGAYLRAPQYLPRYAANLFTPPIESGLPWFTFGAIDFLDGWVKPHHTVFEYGCDGSTLFLAARAARVECVEHNRDWARRVAAALLRRRLANVRFRHEPAGIKPPLANSSYCRALDGHFDIVVVDGWALGKCSNRDRRAVQSRAACFARAEAFSRPGSIIVLDDSWFDPLLQSKVAARRLCFPGIGPWRSGVSRADIFFY